MKPTILLYHITGKKLSGLRTIALRLGLRVLVPAPEQMNLTLDEYLDGKAPSEIADREPSEEMLVFCGLSSQALDALLSAMRQQRISIPLKAVLTETNRGWTPAQLCRQLRLERQALAAGQTVHEA